LDAGTGIAGTVEQLPRPHGEILLLLTHTHHDHLRGLLALGAGQKAGWRPTVAAPEFALRQGWGHSSLGECVAAARVGGVGRLRTTHHAPDRDDTALAAAETGLASLL
jgi:phosphoribosyl 1,2-cyclic phosphodiesterase